MDGAGDFGHKALHFAQAHRIRDARIDRTGLGNRPFRLIDNIPAQHMRMRADGVRRARHRLAQYRQQCIIDERPALLRIDDQVAMPAGMLAVLPGIAVGFEHIKAPEIRHQVDIVLAGQPHCVGKVVEKAIIKAGDRAAAVRVELGAATPVGEDPPAHGVGTIGLQVGIDRRDGCRVIGMLAPLFNRSKIGAIAAIQPGQIDAAQIPFAALPVHQALGRARVATGCRRRSHSTL